MPSPGGSSDPRVHFTADKILLAALLVVLAARAAIAQTSPLESVPLAGNHPAEATTRVPGAHADGTALLNMEVTLALRDRAGLDRLLRDQQDPASPRYHQWLTPAQFTARFGPSQRDLDAVAQWLGSEGFQVTAASLEGRYVRFTGTVSTTERVFSTSIMAFGDGTRYSNITDPAIPARFAGVIGGVGGLSNFLHSRAFMRGPIGAPREIAPASGSQPVLLDSGPAVPGLSGAAPSAVPNVINGGILAFGPSDFHSFYNEDPLLAGGIIGGGGDCIAIVGDSDYTPSAVTLFNTTFLAHLPASSITTVLVDGKNPGVNPDEDEALIDLEWSHAVAPGAPSRFYLGDGSAGTPNGPIVDAIQAAVTDNRCGSIGVSFALCGEPISFYRDKVSPIYAQAASQGQSIFVASGDQGAAGVVLNASMTACETATSRNINELGGDPNVTTVGGTIFSPNFDAMGNNLGHVPESAWNESFGGMQFGTGGGASAIYPKPAYQTGVGVPNDGRRDVPDIALIASLSSAGGGIFVGVGAEDRGPRIDCCFIGTSISAQVWAGIAMLIEQLEKKRPGPLNPRMYALARAGLVPSGFRDVLTGNNDNNGVLGFDAGAGFDLTTGWGTVDIKTFAQAYAATPSPTPTATPTATAPATPTPSPSATPSPNPTATPAPLPPDNSNSSGGGSTVWIAFFSLGLGWSVFQLLRNAWPTGSWMRRSQ